jgi:hypothetical protein
MKNIALKYLYNVYCNNIDYDLFYWSIPTYFHISSCKRDISKKNKLPDSDIFTIFIKVLVENGQSVLRSESEASPIVKSSLTVILALITLPTIILTFIIASIASVVGNEVTPATKEEKSVDEIFDEVHKIFEKAEKERERKENDRKVQEA